MWPQTVDVSGAIRPDGQSLLNLNPIDDDNDSEGVSLSLTFAGDSATGVFVDEEHPEGIPLTLTRPQVVQGRLDPRLRIWDNSFTALSKVDPNEVYRIEATSDGVAYNLTCTIQGSALYEFIGSWRSNNGRKVIDIWESGRLSAGVSAFGDFGRITLKDDSSVIQLADIWFRRHTQGVVGTFTPVDDGSYFYSRGDGSRSIGGKVFLVSR